MALKSGPDQKLACIQALVYDAMAQGRLSFFVKTTLLTDFSLHYLFCFSLFPDSGAGNIFVEQTSHMRAFPPDSKYQVQGCKAFASSF